MYIIPGSGQPRPPFGKVTASAETTVTAAGSTPARAAASVTAPGRPPAARRHRRPAPRLAPGRPDGPRAADAGGIARRDAVAPAAGAGGDREREERHGRDGASQPCVATAMRVCMGGRRLRLARGSAPRSRPLHHARGAPSAARRAGGAIDSGVVLPLVAPSAVIELTFDPIVTVGDLSVRLETLGVALAIFVGPRRGRPGRAAHARGHDAPARCARRGARRAQPPACRRPAVHRGRRRPGRRHRGAHRLRAGPPRLLPSRTSRRCSTSARAASSCRSGSWAGS